jgi:hypothetical protein
MGISFFLFSLKKVDKQEEIQMFEKTSFSGLIVDMEMTEENLLQGSILTVKLDDREVTAFVSPNGFIENLSEEEMKSGVNILGLRLNFEEVYKIGENQYLVERMKR